MGHFHDREERARFARIRKVQSEMLSSGVAKIDVRCEACGLVPASGGWLTYVADRDKLVCALCMQADDFRAGVDQGT